MTMTNCRGCAKPIHHAATKCPHCGAPLPNPTRYKISLGLKLTLLGLVLFVFFLCGGPWMLYYSLYGPPQ